MAVKSPNHRKASDGVDSCLRVRLEQLGRDGMGSELSIRWERCPHLAKLVWGSENVETPGTGCQPAVPPRRSPKNPLIVLEKPPIDDVGECRGTHEGAGRVGAPRVCVREGNRHQRPPARDATRRCRPRVVMRQSRALRPFSPAEALSTLRGRWAEGRLSDWWARLELAPRY